MNAPVSLRKKALAVVAGVLGFAGLVHSPSGMLTGMAIGAVLITCAWPWFLESAIGQHQKKLAAQAVQEAKEAAAKAAASAKLAQANLQQPQPQAAPPVRAPLPVAEQQQAPAMAPVVAPKRQVRRVSKPLALAPFEPVEWPELETTAPQRASGLAMPPD